MTFRSAALLGGYALVLLGFVLARPLLAIDETRYLAVAWEMHLSGDLFHLTRNFASYSHKPPLLFWLINLVWSVTGVSDLAARLVGPALGVATVAATGALAARLWPGDPGARLRAMLVLASLSVFAVYASATMFDALLSLIVLGLVAVLWRIGQGQAQGLRGWPAFGLLLGLGVLAKGPVVLLHILPALVAMRLWADAPPPAREVVRGAALALAIGLGVVLLWLVPALMTGDAAYRHDLLWTQTAGRVTGDLAHGRPIWFLLALLPLLLFPWGLSPRLWRAVLTVLRADRAARLCAIWAGGGLVAFSLIGGKQVHYLLPELPAFALLVARVLPLAGARARGGSLAALVPLCLAAAALAVAAGAVPTVPLEAGAAVGLAVAALGIAALVWRLPMQAGYAAAGLGLPIVLHLAVAFGGPGRVYDSAPIAAEVAAASARGVAVAGMPYNADFNFLARLHSAVATPRTEPELAAWVEEHPEGIVLGPVTLGWIAVAPRQSWTYRGRSLGLWPNEVLTVRGSARVG